MRTMSTVRFSNCMVCGSNAAEIKCTGTQAQRYYEMYMCKECFYEEVIEFAADNGYKPGCTYEDSDPYEEQQEDDETEPTEDGNESGGEPNNVASQEED